MVVINVPHPDAGNPWLGYTWDSSNLPTDRPLGLTIDKPGLRYAVAFFFRDAAHLAIQGQYDLKWVALDSSWDIEFQDPRDAVLFKLTWC